LAEREPLNIHLICHIFANSEARTHMMNRQAVDANPGTLNVAFDI